jgi:hypothetical protein
MGDDLPPEGETIPPWNTIEPTAPHTTRYYFFF